jgi:hypothetical protein
MSKPAFALFLELTGDDLLGGLDDGEAATIAYAIATSTEAVVVTDERKAARIFSERWPHRTLIDTVTLLAQPSHGAQVDEQMLANACFSALTHARMRVPSPGVEWIWELIGDERAAQCPSLRSKGKWGRGK